MLNLNNGDSTNNLPWSKFTNDGFIKLIIKMNEDNPIQFDVRDSGIGLSEQ